jgi:hypothetical protein
MNRDALLLIKLSYSHPVTSLGSLRSRSRLGFANLLTSEESAHIPLQILDHFVRNLIKGILTSINREAHLCLS